MGQQKTVVATSGQQGRADQQALLPRHHQINGNSNKSYAAVSGSSFSHSHPNQNQDQDKRQGQDIDDLGQEGPLSPEINANIFEHSTLSWLSGLFKIGFERQIQEQDLYQILEGRRAKDLGPRLARNWDQEKDRARAKRQTPSLLRALFKSFWLQYLPGYICFELGDVCQISIPWMMQLLLQFIQDSQLSVTPPPATYGYAIACTMYLTALTHNVLCHRWSLGSRKTGIFIQTALIDLVFKKSTTISTRSHLLYPDGSIINLMSTDISRIDNAMIPLLIVIASPIFVIAIIVLLLHMMGPSALLGAAILMLSNPIQGWGMAKLGPVRKLASQLTDQRIRLSTEILQGIKVIKLFAWEDSFLAKLAKVRSEELSHIGRLLSTRGFITATSAAIPVLASALTFALYAWLGHDLKPEIVFPTLAYYAIMRVPFLILPACYSSAVDAYVAIGRLQNYLLAEDLEPTAALDESLEDAIVIDHADFVWDSISSTTTATTTDSAMNFNIINNSNAAATAAAATDDDGSSPSARVYLKDISLRVARGSLIAVIGPVGSGKSSLLQAIVGNMPKSAGQVIRGACTSYASQTPWIQNSSIRDNILFDTDYDEERYWRIIRACCLEQDLDSFPAGDMTEIGERGVNLSGGQKARLSLARSVYFNAGIAIMDDPLSAVDAHVGAKLWKECILKELRGKTRIIATHQLHVLPSVDYIVLMKDGTIADKGTYLDLLAKGGEFAELMSQYGVVGKQDEENDTELRQLAKHDGGRISETETVAAEDAIVDGLAANRNKDAAGDASLKLMTEEEREIGAVSSKVYYEYFKTGGTGIWTAVVLSYLIQQACGLGMNYWLSLWSNQELSTSTSTNIMIYVAFAAAQFMMIAVASHLLSLAIIKTTASMHNQAFNHVVHAPLSFYDTTPIGRILNRFSKDVDVLDSNLWGTLNDIFITLLIILGSVALTIFYFPYLALVILPMAGFYYGLSLYYRSTSREVRRLDSTLRSKLYSYFSETLTGMGTLRAYDRIHLATLRNQQRLDDSNRAHYLFQVGIRWVAFRTLTVGSLLIFMVSLYVVGSRNTINAATAGLVLSYLTRTASDMNWLESNMNSVERLVHYIKNLPQEPPTKTHPDLRSRLRYWPSQGALEFRNVSMRYRPELPYVLRDVSFSVQAGQKIGVVGRTGAGKSSLIQALFLLCDLEQGQVWLDGIDTRTLGTEDLRSSIAIIPQDPILFQGTFRYNLDPLSRHSEQDLWQVLETSDLKTYVQQQEGGLDAEVQAQGENLSVGQRQLVCLSRALLAKSKVVVLDEATASVDLATDALIQRAIRHDFAASTVITVAHRINTIIDYDRILVMDGGQVAEFAAPQVLLRDSGSAFSKLVGETGSHNAALLRAM
ncbi:P-loop containing nucleoside triphosphate hydrolase protein [Linnemannia elongata AG-77]|uniref:p-loop containing nucleoside triphosphate hydrolase protein n=1 Tax=Linnemannia elongata AG-77 TaxID=1314771 RepID=A0A197JR08_9FUNG|nr:P-loop containing nucleoside triphosphate hydrolase protein [Linnemannia elongata AG-77]